MNKAISTGAITDDEKELYMYAYQTSIERVLCWGSVLIISSLFHSVWDALVFMLFYIPLRIYAGGYHARGFFGCYLITVGTFLCFCIVKPLLMGVTNFGVFTTILLCSIVVFMLSPIADPNKPLTDLDKRRYGLLARIILSIELATVAILFITSYGDRLYLPICFSFFMACMMLLASKFTGLRKRMS